MRGRHTVTSLAADCDAGVRRAAVRSRYASTGFTAV